MISASPGGLAVGGALFEEAVEEIFADNDVKIAGNDAKLIADLIRLQGHV